MRGAAGSILGTLALGLLLPPAHAEVTETWSNSPNTDSGLRGLHLNRPTSEALPHGLSLDLDGTPVWDTTAIDYATTDLVLAYSHQLQADNLRMRADDARLVLGPRIGQPALPFQMMIDAGTAQAPLGGLAVGCWGYQWGVYLYQKNGKSRRTNLNFQGLFSWLTDTQQTGSGDFALWNYQTGSKTLSVSPANEFMIAAPKESFFGALPVARPTVAGSWSDGTAAHNLVQALVGLGLVMDATTP